ncbi:hypothetical protein [Kocuria rosea]|uniref:hypothetical protein n=1 Tax=Kocuria rosea TaxID=1275 RepID=UPI00119E72A8|nr:hypothetical protein [Kocuria rosea]
MEHHANAAADGTPQLAVDLIPTARQTVVRTLPACAVAIIGIPLLAWFTPRDTSELRTPWELLIVLAALGLFPLIHRLTRAPRPRIDDVGRAQWKRALASAARTRSLPSNPQVRTATGVIACTSIEAFMMVTAILLGTLLGEIVRPEFSWSLPVGGAMALAIGFAFRLRSSWSYLSVLHAEAQGS